MSVSHSTASPGDALWQLIRRLHFYIGLFVGPFILVAALTGTLYVLTPQLESWLYRDALTSTPQAEVQPLARQVAVARQRLGEAARIVAVRPAPGPHDTTRVLFSDPALAAGESRALFIDPYSLQIKGDLTVYGTSGILPLRLWLDKLHRSLLLGEPGRAYSELAASWLWVAALGGLVLWQGQRARRRNGVLQARHWHQQLGLLLLAGLLFFSATGLTWSRWAGGNIALLRAQLGWLTPQLHSQLAEHHAMPAQGEHAQHMADMTLATGNPVDPQWDAVLQAARQAGLTTGRLELKPPKAADQAWIVNEIDRRWPTRVDGVAVHPQSLAILDRTRFAEFPLVAKLTRWGIDAHMGVLFGLPNQLLLVAFGLGLCGLILLGYRIWWLKRPAPGRQAPLRTLASAWLALGGMGRGLSILLALALGWALPVLGVSLLIFLLLDSLRWWRLARRSLATA
ncbi:PepSY-associated TM helix domain-containing protein [Pseudaeromonas paramecii]|uniref:PepSY-associated TM helix domain-containing protein n=1 Tax=Pseudaeromonas paramecii TaxID=2138166 RepID=A0ABP8QKG8_9GAMM